MKVLHSKRTAEDTIKSAVKDVKQNMSPKGSWGKGNQILLYKMTQPKKDLEGKMMENSNNTTPLSCN